MFPESHVGNAWANRGWPMSASTSETRLVEIGMPRLSDSMEEATILNWLKRPGDEVARGEPLVEVETDKATMVYEAETDGVLEEIVVDDGATAPLGAVIARVRVGGGDGAPSTPAPPIPHRPPARPPRRREEERRRSSSSSGRPSCKPSTRSSPATSACSSSERTLPSQVACSP